MLLLPTLGIEGVFATYKKTIFIAVYNILTRILMLIFIVLPVVVFGGNIIHAIYGWIAVSVLSLLIASYFKRIPFKNVDSTNSNLKIKEVFQYSLPLVFASVAGITIKAADQFYISRFFGAEIFAEFSNGFIELPFIAMVTVATSTVLMPIFSKDFHENKTDRIIQTWREAITKSAMIIYPILLYFIVYGKELMILIYSEDYINSGAYFQINMFLNFFNIVIFTPLFFAMGKTKQYAVAHLFFAIIIWMSHYGVIVLFDSPIAIALNSTALNILKILFFVYLASRLMKVNFKELFPLKKLANYLIHSSLSIFFTFEFMKWINSFSLSINTFLSLTIYLFLILVSAPLFKIKYWDIIKPIISKLK